MRPNCLKTNPATVSLCANRGRGGGKAVFRKHSQASAHCYQTISIAASNLSNSWTENYSSGRTSTLKTKEINESIPKYPLPVVGALAGRVNTKRYPIPSLIEIVISRLPCRRNLIGPLGGRVGERMCSGTLILRLEPTFFA